MSRELSIIAVLMFEPTQLIFKTKSTFMVLVYRV